MKALIKIVSAFLFIGFHLLCLHLSMRPVSAQQELSRGDLEFFEKKIRPVLESSCYMCHSTSSRKPQGGLLLDSREGMLKGGNSGQAAITPGDPDRSPLIKALRYSDPKLQMPPAGQLPAEQVRDFEAWVRMGAPDPRGQSPAARAAWQPYDLSEARKFWSFQPIRNPPLPRVKHRAR